jgi:cytosine/adenosine deaminase-related metal-dependent hydrolase
MLRSRRRRPSCLHRHSAELSQGTFCTFLREFSPQTATLNLARVLEMTDSLGSIEPGKLADLVLVDANPLEDIRNTQKIRAVVANGQLYRRADLNRLLATVEALNKQVENREEGIRGGITRCCT